ncbi:uncharacterized protein isoform X2 [Bombus fervidus]
MKNIEKVWKAEQQQSQEKKKIAELKKEIEMEKDREDMKKYAMEQGVIEKKDDKKLDWMYKGPNQLVNREEYLLGRPIDKSFEQMVQAEKDNELNQAPRNHVEHECIPPSLRFFSGNEQVDLARKMQEDPLYAIKKKEMETRNQLLKNPVKLKQLRQLLEQQSKKSKSEKKKKKNKQDIDSDDETQLDLLLATKYKQLKDKISNKDLIKSMKKVKHKRKKKSKKENETSNSESESSNEGSESDEHIKKHKKKRSKSKEKNTEVIKHSKERYLVSDKEEERKHKSYEKLVKACNSNNDNNDSSIKKRRDRSFNRDIRKHKDKDFRSSSPQNRRSSTHKNTYNTENKYKDLSKRSHEKETTYSKSSSDTNRYKYYKEDKNRDKWNFKKKQDLTEEEKERRRQEMIANATWRDEERERNVKKYRIEEKKEIDSRKVYNQDFVTKQLAAAAEISTVASRIRANINNIQRSGRAMDTNFAKR